MLTKIWKEGVKAGEGGNALQSASRARSGGKYGMKRAEEEKEGRRRQSDRAVGGGAQQILK